MGKVQRILDYMDKRVAVCREGVARWEAIHKQRGCEFVSVATERSALMEAELIQRELYALAGCSLKTPGDQ